MKSLPILLSALMISAPLFYASAQEVPDGPALVDRDLTVEKIAQGLTLPTAMSFVDNNTALVLEKDNGTVRVVVDGKIMPEAALDVAVATNSNRGVLGIDAAEVNGTKYV